MIRARFNGLEEFRVELETRPPNVERVLRVTRRYDSSPAMPIRNVSVVATYLRAVLSRVDGAQQMIVVKLDCYVGQSWGKGFEHDAKVEARADEVIAALRQAAESLGMEIAPGVYEETSER